MYIPSVFNLLYVKIVLDKIKVFFKTDVRFVSNLTQKYVRLKKHTEGSVQALRLLWAFSTDTFLCVRSVTNLISYGVRIIVKEMNTKMYDEIIVKIKTCEYLYSEFAGAVRCYTCTYECPWFLCRLRSIATHRDHFVRRLSVRPSVCPSVTLAELCFAGDTCIPRNAATIFK